MMNRDEAVQKLATVGHLSIAHAEDLYDSFFEKPVVPQYVADWLEENDWRKDTSGRQTIFDAFDNLTLDASNGFYVDVKKWVEENGNIFAQAWTFGYEVEKEPRYTVRIKATNQYLCNDGIGPHFSPGFRTDFTKTDLEKSGFDWVFNCEGMEVKEVTDE